MARVGPLQFDRLGSHPWPPGIHLQLISLSLAVTRNSPNPYVFQSILMDRNNRYS